jgi:hypothetical protein
MLVLHFYLPFIKNVLVLLVEGDSKSQGKRTKNLPKVRHEVLTTCLITAKVLVDSQKNVLYLNTSLFMRTLARSKRFSASGFGGLKPSLQAYALSLTHREFISCSAATTLAGLRDVNQVSSCHHRDYNPKSFTRLNLRFPRSKFRSPLP